MKTLVILSCLALSGCAAFSPLDLAPAGSITVEKAMEDVGAGFVQMNKKLQEGDVKTGMIACRTTLKLDVSATADQGGKLTLDLHPGSSITTLSSNSGLTAEQTNSSHAERSNHIEVDLVHAACLPKETVGYEHPDKIGLIYGAGPGSTRTKSTYFTIFNKKPESR